MSEPVPDDAVEAAPHAIYKAWSGNGGDPIETYTFWLDFGEQGEVAISADLTAFHAAMKRGPVPDDNKETTT